MSKRDKLIQKIFKGNSDVTPDEAVKILETLDFKMSPTGGSHLTFRKLNRPSVTIVLTQNPLKPYMLEKLQETLKNEGYKND
ncbi:MAG: type II toxin-antitoxin system HicA family toxin [Treponema sp.]|jgi:predicted RNA binding protein YcfA (HicA-like mRNA interferase family)|nr:type II toxin-antitoxin system HicA family toxin [Treponema sp.]